jgi:two-component system, NtrC family, sensor histidine kinase HydH
MKPFSAIRPRSIIAIAITLSVILVVSSLVELRQSRDEVYHILREEALSLAETIIRSSANNLLSLEQIEDLLTERLFNNAYYIARLDSLGSLSDRDLAEVAAANHINRINIFDADGVRVLSSWMPEPGHGDLPEKHSPRDIIAPILSGETDRMVIGLKEARIAEGQRYAVALRRTRRGGGAIVLNLDAADLLEFRKTIGIGKLIRDLGDNSGIAYVVLQDTLGIIAASGAVRELTTIESDPVLRTSAGEGTVVTRTTTFGNEEVFEVVHPFSVNGTPVGLFRIGLAMDEVHAVESRMLRRVVVMTAVLAVIGIFAVTMIVASQNYRLLENRYRSVQSFTGRILEQMQDAVITVDTEDVVTIFNPQAEVLFGASAADIAGRPLTEIGLSSLSAILKGNVGHTEAEVERTDGVRRSVAVTLSRVDGDPGMAGSRTAVIRDLTQSRQLEREMQRKDKLRAMGELASGVAHEIRNPLNAIAMIAQRFGREFTPKEGEAEFADLAHVLQAEAQRVNAIVRQFLLFARPPDLHLSMVSLGESIRRIGSAFDAQATAKGVRFQMRIDEEVGTLIDREQFSQAILNLLQNALDATDEGGIISISCGKDNTHAVIRVSDSGSGIPDEQQRKIFDLYYTTKQHGTGMGLPITQRIISQHDGTIDVTSAPDRGTEFVIRLPLPGVRGEP